MGNKLTNRSRGIEGFKLVKTNYIKLLSENRNQFFSLYVAT